MRPPATASCASHRELVALALTDGADDATLEAYAREVPECLDCRRALASELVVHPALLTGDDGLTGMVSLSAALAIGSSSRRSRWASALMAPASPTVRRLAVGALALAIAAGTSWVAAAWLDGTATTSAPRMATRVPLRPPVAERSVAVGAPAQAVALSPAVADPPPAVPVPKRGRSSPTRLQTGAAAPPLTANDDAVAEADWPAPPYEDLARGGAKGGASAVRAVQLVVTGGHAVGQAAGLVTVASAETELAVCVEGPERGVVWRGAVPAGRTDLRRGAGLVSFAFAAPGTYRFSVSTSDLAGCRAPVHVVEVEVSP